MYTVPPMDGRTVSFTIPGDPVPQPRARVSTVGGFARAYVPSGHPIHTYREAIALSAVAAGARATPAAPLCMELHLVFQRPASHYHTSRARWGQLKDTAKPLPRCDSSNVLKGIEDSLNGIAYVDDSQIGRHVIVRRYAGPGEIAHTSVTITEDVTPCSNQAETSG